MIGRFTRLHRGCWLTVWFAVTPVVLAAPLTLDAVLTHADSAHPVLELARAQGELAQAEAQLAQSLNDFRVNLDASLRTGRNPVFNDHFSPDHLIKLNARKTLLDFGRQQSGAAAAEEEREAHDLLIRDIRAHRRVSLMARYFDVLLADMRDAAETESMAVAYVNWDNAKERLAVGQMAQWQVAELESRFLESLARRDDLRRGLREKRMALGTAMNLPGMLLDDLADPKLPDNERVLPTFDDLLAQMQTGNPRMAAQKRLLAAANQRLNGVRAENRPSIEFEAEAAAWSRDSTTRDELRAGFNLVWPLWQGGRDAARLSREQARFHALQAEHDQLLMELRQSLLEAREEIQYLRGAGRRSAELNADFRDQALDKARAEYEMELKTNLGSSMAETQFAHLRRRGVEYRLALAWARLDALLGVPDASTKQPTTQTTVNMESK